MDKFMLWLENAINQVNGILSGESEKAYYS